VRGPIDPAAPRGSGNGGLLATAAAPGREHSGRLLGVIADWRCHADRLPRVIAVWRCHGDRLPRVIAVWRCHADRLPRVIAVWRCHADRLPRVIAVWRCHADRLPGVIAVWRCHGDRPPGVVAVGQCVPRSLAPAAQRRKSDQTTKYQREWSAKGRDRLTFGWLAGRIFERCAPRCGSMLRAERIEGIVRGVATTDRARLLATLTPSTPPAFVPPRGQASSGYFDVDSMLSAETTWPRPVPALIFPDLGSSRKAAPTGAVSAQPLSRSPRAERTSDLPAAAVPIRPTTGVGAAAAPVGAAANIASILGLAAVWVASAGAAAIVVTMLVARGHAPVSCPVVTRPPPTVTPESVPAQCPKPAWEPPEVAVGDLPRAAAPRAIAQPQAREPEASPTPPLPPPIRAATVSPRSHGLHAKASPPATSSPRSLEDWMRRSVSAN
jgi:hypothetical protein